MSILQTMFLAWPSLAGRGIYGGEQDPLSCFRFGASSLTAKPPK